jgi:ABC-2 type transport system permease protein
MFTLSFGFFFGNGNSGAGKVALINQSKTPIAQNLESAIMKSDILKTQKETDISFAKDQLKRSKVAAIIIIPNDFGSLNQTSPKQIEVVEDPGNQNTNAVVVSVLNSYLNNVNFQVQNTKPIFSVDEQKTNERELTYFDFVLIGLIGLSLMNSSVQGIAISMAQYREEKILKRITTTPVKPWKFVISEVSSRLILNLAQILVTIGIGVIFFNAHIYGNFFIILLLSLVGAVLFQTLGFAIASATKTIAAAQGMAMSITIPMMFLAGVFFAIDALPNWLFNIVQFLPLAPFLRILRQYALETTSPFLVPMNMIIIGGWIVVLLVISIWRFKLSDE